MKRRHRKLIHLRMLGLALALASACTAACASDTEGRIVPLELAVEPEAEAGHELGTFVTATGWTVTLDRAELALSAIYAFAPEREPGAMARLSRLLVPVARAHGGHDPLSGKRVRAELVEPVVVDLLDGERRTLAELDGEAGSVATLAVDLAEPSAAILDELGGHQARVSGVAVRDDETVRFEGGLQVPDEGLTRRVETPLSPFSLDAGATLVLGLRASVWLDDAVFERLEPADGDAPREITPDSQVSRAWFIGVRSPAAFSLRSIPKEMAHD